jgi:nuclear transport factor 2 (NTF2) superfamily protein
MALAPGEKDDLIRRYEQGPAKLRAAFGKLPERAHQWRPAPDRWSAHEVICHCADAETNAAWRIRHVIAEKEPVVQGYDQAKWAREFDYHSHPLAPAFALIESVRANTAALIRRLPEEAWERAGRHTESGPYTASDWLRIYAEHLEKHSRQIEGNLMAWNSARNS